MARVRFQPPLFAAFTLLAALAYGQETPIRPPGGAASLAPVWTEATPGVWRAAGQDTWSAVRYVRFLVLSSAAGPESRKSPGTAEPDLEQPALMGQCTRTSDGKLRFELFANFGGLTDWAFYPPWHSTGEHDLFAPRPARVVLTMEFLGYTHVKPFKRQFEQVLAPGPPQLRYLNPGGSSANMEPPGWFFQYLRALPTLRLSTGSQTASFPTAAWLAALHGDPVCRASGA